VGPVNGIAGDYLAPMSFFEFDPLTGLFTLIANSLNPNNISPFAGRFLPLPNGDVLFSNGTGIMLVYEPGGGPDPGWLSTIYAIEDFGGNPVSTLAPNSFFRLFGRQLNGLSQAASYGDDAQIATNYPLVRIQNNASNRVAYCRTQNHSSMGAATGSIIHHTEFLVPSGMDIGASELRVIANGIASNPVALTIV
jgi:hypothetical protein